MRCLCAGKMRVIYGPPQFFSTPLLSLELQLNQSSYDAKKNKKTEMNLVKM